MENNVVRKNKRKRGDRIRDKEMCKDDGVKEVETEIKE